MQKNLFLKQGGMAKLVVLSFFFLFMISFISAVPPVQTSTIGTETINVYYPPYEYMPQNQAMYLNIHATNASSILTNITTSCNVHIYDNGGSHLVTEELSYKNVDSDWETTLLAGNFSTLGIHAWILQCNTSSEVGTASGAFEVTPSGQGGNSNIVFYVFIILMIYAITFFGFFNGNIPITILGGMCMMFLGIYTITNGIIIYRDVLTNYFSYVTISVGAICAFWALLEQFDVI